MTDISQRPKDPGTQNKAESLSGEEEGARKNQSPYFSDVIKSKKDEKTVGGQM